MIDRLKKLPLYFLVFLAAGTLIVPVLYWVITGGDLITESFSKLGGWDD